MRAFSSGAVRCPSSSGEGKRSRRGTSVLEVERKMKWKLEEIARRKEGKGKKVWLSYGKIRIGGFGRRGSKC